MNEKDKKIIDEFLKSVEFDFNEYDEFVSYIQRRGMLNQDLPVYKKILFTKQNLKNLYEEYINPIKKTLSLLKISYKELSELTGYTEGSLKNSSSKGKMSEPMKKAMILLLEIDRLQLELSSKTEQLESLKIILKQ